MDCPAQACPPLISHRKGKQAPRDVSIIVAPLGAECKLFLLAEATQWCCKSLSCLSHHLGVSITYHQMLLPTDAGGLQSLESFPYSPWMHVQHLEISVKASFRYESLWKKVEGAQVNLDLICLHYLLAVWPWSHYLNSLRLISLECYHMGSLWESVRICKATGSILTAQVLSRWRSSFYDITSLLLNPRDQCYIFLGCSSCISVWLPVGHFQLAPLFVPHSPVSKHPLSDGITICHISCSSAYFLNSPYHFMPYHPFF